MIIWNFLGQIMAKILEFFYYVIPNYGWGIVFITLFLRLLLFPTSISQVRSMEKMKIIQPKIKEIQEKYKDKPEEVQRRMMEIYREYKVNPLGGCLPLLIQMPFLIALYRVLQMPANFGIDQLQSQHFFGLMLSDVRTTGNIILAVISAGATFLQQKVMSPQASSGDGSSSMQSAFLYFMPLFFGWITYTMPAAIGVYWVAQSIIGFVQQKVIIKFFVTPANSMNDSGTRRLEPHAAGDKTPGKSGNPRRKPRPSGR